ncbi:MAG TPA: hypothetical protein VE074_03715 [Jatrophihabitantaceae bacterium]|nr:hypothetical protein [Jatrophihabitantaceae bacterium]
MTSAFAERAVARLSVDLPDGWWCLDLNESALSDQVARLYGALREAGRPATAAAEQNAIALANWLHGEGASIALLRPGNDALATAICGGVFVRDPLPVAGDVLFAALDADGEAVALGDLDGIPIVSHVRRTPADDPPHSPMLHVSYFICAPSMCIVITFVVAETSEIHGVKGVVAEVARVVSGARVVHSDSGCPV